MSFETETLPFSLLEHSQDHKQKELFAAWRSNGLSEMIMRYADHLILMSSDAKTGLPVELFKGDKSLAAKVLGELWQPDLATCAGSKDIFRAYDASSFGEPTFQYVSHKGQRNNNKFHVRYERLVLPFKIGGGLPQFVTLSSLVSFELQPIVARSHGNDFSPSHTASSQILLGTEQLANL